MYTPAHFAESRPAVLQDLVRRHPLGLLLWRQADGLLQADSDDAPAPFLATMMTAIIGIEIVLTELRGKWKVSQNRSAADRAGVAAGLAAAGVGAAEWLAPLAGPSSA